ncbi:MAG: cell division protein SepF [Candidatus Aenigmarchaeota archaeon]|nr:cell division protein SepF [Candidatus Aenigmarchaeota archaeon]
MVLEKLFGKSVGGEESYIELDTSAAGAEGGKVPIFVDKLVDFADSDRIQKSLRNGSIVLVKIKPLKEKDMSELKRAIEKLRKTCVALNGDIAGIDEDWIILCPSFARIARD